MKAKLKSQSINDQLKEIRLLIKEKDLPPLNLIEAAQYLSLSHSTLYKLSYQRKIPVHKPTGKRLYFFKHELDEWITKEAGDGRPKTGEEKRKKEKRRLNIELDEEELEPP